ncbi:Pheromone-regulated membrane protein 10 [Bienertia sinuspersici]
MKYRRRGGFNRRGPIIRPPHYKNNHHVHAISPTELDTPTSDMATLQTQEVATSTQQIGASNSEETTKHIPDVNSSDQVLETSTTNLRNMILENEETIISDQTGNQKKEDLVLDPNGLWSTHCTVVDVISETSYKSYFKGPYYNWNMTPPEHEFSWDPFNAKKVRLVWQSKCSKRLTDVVSKICSKPAYCPRRCAHSVREEMIQIRKIEEFQKNPKNFKE